MLLLGVFWRAIREEENACSWYLPIPGTGVPGQAVGAPLREVTTPACPEWGWVAEQPWCRGEVTLGTQNATLLLIHLLRSCICLFPPVSHAPLSNSQPNAVTCCVTIKRRIFNDISTSVMLLSLKEVISND